LEDAAKEGLQALIDAKQAQLEAFVDTVRSEALTFASVRLLPMSIASMGPSLEEHRKERNHGISEADIAAQREELRAWYEANFQAGLSLPE
jgi:hypothetical protein